MPCCDGNTGFYDGANLNHLDVNGPEIQMERTKRHGYKLDTDKVFETDRLESFDKNPKVAMARRNRSQLKVYIPQAEQESVSSGPSTRNVTM